MCYGSSPLLGASESPLRQGFPPENACDAALAAVADRLCLFSFERLVFLSCLNLKLSAPSSLPAISRRPLTPSPMVSSWGWMSRPYRGSPAAARPSPWPRSSNGCSVLRWCWRTTKRWPPSSVRSSRSFSRTMLSSISSPTTTIISRRHISPTRTPSLRRTPASTRRSTGCATAPPPPSLNGGM